MHITVANPDNPLDSPAYDGESKEAHTRLAAGEYAATVVSDDEYNGTEVALLVGETFSFAAPVVDIDHIHHTHPDHMVTILNDDDPNGDDWKGLASQAHRDPELGPGTYSARYIDADGEAAWGSLIVEDGNSYLDTDDEDLCSRCGASLDNGEGYDGLCGNCADRAENEGRWAHHDA